jgi:hypothetical protein
MRRADFAADQIRDAVRPAAKRARTAVAEERGRMATERDLTPATSDGLDSSFQDIILENS